MHLEGHRFFDLVRWGIAAETLNGYLDKEKERRDFLKDAAVVQPERDEYYPIPQREIDFTKGLYEQNPGTKNMNATGKRNPASRFSSKKV
ncbi:MAG: RagB/SusD family nutrient uptake outer membrane protein [Bacteroidales bacterium]|nr:RagB/SusD family nutrient uptake outer membrane protein [Bacteroidales bacterium]